MDAHLQQRLQRHGVAVDAAVERTPLQQLHGDEVLAIVHADVVNGADVGMVQRRSRPRLPLKSLQRLSVLRLCRQKFERHAAAQPGVLGLKHHAHAALAQMTQHAVM